MWGYRTCRVAGVRALRALRALVRPSHPHVGLLFRVWATPPTYGTDSPRAEQAARVRKKGYSPTPGSPQCAQARYVEPGPSHPHVGLLFRVWATSPACGIGGPRAGQAARVRDRRPACERRGAALHQARCNARKLAMWSLGLLIRTWACCSESGQPRPCTGQAARVRDALESKSLLYAANPHLRLLSMGARPHRLALHPF